MKKPMKTTDKIVLGTSAVGVVATAALYWWIPDMHWGVYVGAWFLVSGAGYGVITQQIANERLANRDTTDKP